MSAASQREPPHLRLVRFFHESNTSGPLVLALLVGLSADLAAVSFRWAISAVHDLFFGAGALLRPLLGRYWVLLVPAAGGLIVGPLVTLLTRDTKGAGVPDVTQAVDDLAEAAADAEPSLRACITGEKET